MVKKKIARFSIPEKEYQPSFTFDIVVIVLKNVVALMPIWDGWIEGDPIELHSIDYNNNWNMKYLSPWRNHFQ